MSVPRLFAIVPAAGGGTRFGGNVAKQYADLAGRSVIAHSIDRLQTLPLAALVVALAPGDREFARCVEPRIGVEAIECGGATRAATVRNAVAALADRGNADDWILVHDAARPCVPRASLRRLVTELGDDAVGGLLAIPVADTLKRADGSGPSPRVIATQDRAHLWQAQTPQMFRYAVLHAALSRSGVADCTDEAQAVEGLAETGFCAPPRLVRGSAANLKITYAEDLLLAIAVLASEKSATQ